MSFRKPVELFLKTTEKLKESLPKMVKCLLTINKDVYCQEALNFCIGFFVQKANTKILAFCTNIIFALYTVFIYL